MGLKIVMGGTKLTDLTAPKLPRYDPMEAAGSLLLIETRHPLSRWPFGVPSDGDVMPNVLSSFARARTGASTDLEVSPTFLLGADWQTKPFPNGFIERSVKQGLHGIPSPLHATPTARASIGFPEAIETYILDNPTHDFYMSSWVDVTRAGASTSLAELVNVTTAAANYLMVSRVGSNIPPVGRAPVGLGPALSNVHKIGYTGATPANAGYQSAHAFDLGSAGAYSYNDSLRKGKAALIHYRFYLEDLTASGRSYAKADALDLELFTREVLTEGGRYYGDTHVNPGAIE